MYVFSYKANKDVDVNRAFATSFALQFRKKKDVGLESL